MGVQEELQFLRGKVSQLEDMMMDMNNNLKLIVNKLVKQRARHIAKKKVILQDEESDCLSLLSGLVFNPVQLFQQQQEVGTRAQTHSIDEQRIVYQNQISGSQNRSNAKMSKTAKPDSKGAHMGAVKIHDQARPRLDFEILSANRNLDVEEVMFDDIDNTDILDLDESQWDNGHLKVELHSNLGDELLEPGMEINEDYEFGDSENELNMSENCTNAAQPNFAEPQIRRKRRYQMTRTFQDETSAKEFVTSQRTWTVNKTRQTAVGKKVFYQCKISKKCPVYIYIHELAPGGEVDLYECGDEHVHTQKRRRFRQNVMNSGSLVLPSTSNTNANSGPHTPPKLTRKPQSKEFFNQSQSQPHMRAGQNKPGT